MNDFKCPISWTTILREGHINWDIIVQQGNVITLEKDKQGAVNLQQMVYSRLFRALFI